MTDLIKRLRYDARTMGELSQAAHEAADEIASLRAERDRFAELYAKEGHAKMVLQEYHSSEIASLRAVIATAREALEWYAEPVLTYAVTQINEPRSAVHADGGKRARAALARIAALDVPAQQETKA